MTSESAVIEVQVNSTRIQALVDSSCNAYALIDAAHARKLRLPFVEEKPRQFSSFAESTAPVTAQGVVAMTLEIGGYEQTLFAYAVQGLGEELFLGKP